MTIKVLIVESDPNATAHIQRLLALESDFQVVGTVDEVSYTTFNTISTLQLDVILVAITPVDDATFDRIRQLVKHFPAVATVMILPQPDTETLRQAVLAGARDFLEKPLDADKLYSTIRRVYESYAPIRASYAALGTIDTPSYSIPRKLAEAEEQSKEESPDIDDVLSLPPMPAPIIRPPKPIAPMPPLPTEEEDDDEYIPDIDDEIIRPPSTVTDDDEASPDLDDGLILPPLPAPISPIAPPKPISPPSPITEEDGRFIDKEAVDRFEGASPEPESPVILPPQPAPIITPAPISPIAPPAPKPSEPDSPAKQVFFSAYYPHESQADRKNGLYVYAHLEDALAAIHKDVEKFKEELGGAIPQPRTSKQSAKIAENTPITIIPESDDIQFEPESLTKRWREPFTRFDFDFFPSKTLVDESAVVRVSVQINGIEIASIKCGIDVVEAKPEVISQPIADDNPLASARFTHQQAETYRKIFISYSRKDSQVARAYQMAQLAMGNEVFLDVDSLRAGENWQAALARAIDSADIFQMFWSSSYAASEYCRYEWDYALRYRCPDQKCEGFIRPVYWVNPMPAQPPSELGHLNFKYIPFSLEP